MSFTYNGRVYPDGAQFPSTEKRYPVYTNAQFHRAVLARLERERAEAKAKGDDEGEVDSIDRGFFLPAGASRDEVPSGCVASDDGVN